MTSNLSARVAKLAAAQAALDDQAWWQRPGAVAEARREGEHKLAAFLFRVYAEHSSPEQVTAALAAEHPGYPDAYSEDERTQIILQELFHKNPDLKADIHRALKEHMRAEGLMR